MPLRYFAHITISIALSLSTAHVASAARVVGRATPSRECFVALNIEGDGVVSGKTVSCVEGDPTCDHDGVCGNDSCTYDVQLCINVPDLPGCIPPAALKSLRVRPSTVPVPTSLVGPACGVVGQQVAALKPLGGTLRTGHAGIVATATSATKPFKTDRDEYILKCVPRDTPCPVSTTTTSAPPTSTTTTATTIRSTTTTAESTSTTTESPTTTTTAASTSTTTESTTTTGASTTTTAESTTSTTELTTSTTQSTTSTTQSSTSTTETTTTTTQSTTSTTTTLANLIFVTSASYNGNLGGLAGADAACQALANDAELAGTYKAWLSDSTASAADRLSHSTRSYRLVDETLVASDWDDLTDETLSNPINETEFGEGPVEDSVWTASQVDGLSYFFSCSDWTDGSEGSGTLGWSAASNSSWTDDDLFGCAASLRLYCVQQDAMAPTTTTEPTTSTTQTTTSTTETTTTTTLAPDPCSPNPCQNGGTCFRSGDFPASASTAPIGLADFFCSCVPQWTGTTCDTCGTACSSRPEYYKDRYLICAGASNGYEGFECQGGPNSECEAYCSGWMGCTGTIDIDQDGWGTVTGVVDCSGPF